MLIWRMSEVQELKLEKLLISSWDSVSQEDVVVYSCTLPGL